MPEGNDTCDQCEKLRFECFKYYQVYAQNRGMKQFPHIGVVYARSVAEAMQAWSEWAIDGPIDVVIEFDDEMQRPRCYNY
jgi:hypothetical protein